MNCLRNKKGQFIKGHFSFMNKKKHTDEAKRKMSKKAMGKNNSMYGRHHSEETKRKISKALKGIKKQPVSKETRKKLSDSHKGQKLEYVHKSDCQCSFCKAKRGEFKDKNSPCWKGGSRQYWQSLSREIWEEYHNRKIPKDHLIHHKDGNWKNIKPENLELMKSRSVHMKYHMQLNKLKGGLNVT